MPFTRAQAAPSVLRGWLTQATLGLSALASVAACSTPKVEDVNDPTSRAFAPKGVIRGTVFYQGPAPCTEGGHVVGSAVLLVFDRRNPPPPAGLANTAQNFVTVSGDVLFANVPRSQAASVCPVAGAPDVTASAPFTISPLEAGSYILQSFYDYSGVFLPSFGFRNLPVAGDVGGGYVDTNDALTLVSIPSVDPDAGIPLADGGVFVPKVPKSADANYQPVYLPIDVGTPGPVDPQSLRGVPTFTIPDNGFLADNVTVTLGATIATSRPYFYAAGVDPTAGIAAPTDPRYDLAPASAEVLPYGSTSTPSNPDGDPRFVPIMTLAQDYALYAQPLSTLESDILLYQKQFPAIRINAGLTSYEVGPATDPANPFHLQLTPASGGLGAFLVFWDGTHANAADNTIPEGVVPKLWPLVVFSKLRDDLTGPTAAAPQGLNLARQDDPQSLVAQGADLTAPLVILQGITLDHDSLYQTAFHPPPVEPSAATMRDHVTVLVRPSALCVDPRHPDRGGLLVTPHLQGPFPPGVSTPLPVGDVDLFSPATVIAHEPTLVREVRRGCLPLGRYAVNVVYPTGQAWTTPNELGGCATEEGGVILPGPNGEVGSCSLQPRPVLPSQGGRGVVEVVPATDPTACAPFPVPPECTTLAPE